MRRKKLHSLPTNKSSSLFQGGHSTHFKRQLGKTSPRLRTFDWHFLGYQPHDLSHLGDPFDKKEIKKPSSPADRAPEPDCFTSIFLQGMLGHNKNRFVACFPAVVWQKKLRFRPNPIQHRAHPKKIICLIDKWLQTNQPHAQYHEDFVQTSGK